MTRTKMPRSKEIKPKIKNQRKNTKREKLKNEKG